MIGYHEDDIDDPMRPRCGLLLAMLLGALSWAVIIATAFWLYHQ